ncbi:MAG: di-trans,poly-cis-decaprenylcistransferase [Bacilli bacterium]|nr:di-trans,poly-cis-decaprenylcistransferase [Bacilli bacterium]
MEQKNSIAHIAFIMDGNGRWAKARHLPRHLGHKEGCERVSDIYEECLEQGVKVMSLYAFSTENWNRPKAEINHLFNYLDFFFKREHKKLIEKGVRVMVSGDISRLPLKSQKTINKAIEESKNCNKFVFNICLNYGGKAEIVRAAKLFAQEVKDGKINIEDLTEAKFEDYLYTKGLPPVDLLIRTSGEQRTSNYLPWQLAYAEFIFTPTPWPAFTKEEFRKCLEEYYHRSRRFGEIKDEKE